MQAVLLITSIFACAVLLLGILLLLMGVFVFEEPPLAGIMMTAMALFLLKRIGSRKQTPASRPPAHDGHGGSFGSE